MQSVVRAYVDLTKVVINLEWMALKILKSQNCA